MTSQIREMSQTDNIKYMQAKGIFASDVEC